MPISVALLNDAAAPTVSGSVSDVMSIVSSIMTTIEGNSLLFMFAVAGLIGIAVGVVRSLIGRY